jgi:hypothetical protein
MADEVTGIISLWSSMSIHRETHNDFLIDEKALTFHDFDLI